MSEIKIGAMCDCESEICENKDAHDCGSCPSEAVARVAIHGEKQNLCEDCFDTARGFFSSTKQAFVILEDRRQK